jgi:hypothetical protein
MDVPTRAAAPSVVPDDDPWAALAAPEAPPVPTRGDLVKPTMPWDVADPATVPETDPCPPTVGSPPGDRAPEPVPTAVAASTPQVSFPPGVAAKLADYVYLLVDARTGRPFHVGRGRDDRCFRHVEAARPRPDGAATGEDADGRFAALDRIRDAESDGRPVRIEVLRHGLTTAEADLVVASVDDVLALGQPTVLGSQRTPAVELGATLAKRAKIKRSHRVVLLRVGPHGADTSYGAARHGWRIGRRWVDPASVRSPWWAVLVAGDLVDAVYRIDGWEPSPATAAPAGVERWSFAGERDPELEVRYSGRSVAAYLGAGTPNQVTYVWCGPHWVNTAQ